MSDTPQGPGRWLASDGQWYPPELHPDYGKPLPPPPPAADSAPLTSVGAGEEPSAPLAKNRSVLRALLVAASLVGVLVVVYLANQDRGPEGVGPPPPLTVAPEPTLADVPTQVVPVTPPDKLGLVYYVEGTAKS